MTPEDANDEERSVERFVSQDTKAPNNERHLGVPFKRIQ
jgi:hypothetical protein